jgi:hypothetical protein
MHAEPGSANVDHWQRFVLAYNAMTAARIELFADRAGLTAFVRHGLHAPGERAAALDAAARLTIDELQDLFPDLLALASFVHGLTERCRELILRLPRAWLLANIERHAAPLLSAGGEEEYRALLDLYDRIDPALASQLAERAAQADDEDIKEAGNDYLRSTGSNKRKGTLSGMKGQ